MKAAPPNQLAPLLAERIRNARRRYRRRLEQAQQKFSEIAVHQLRVATRRMLAVTELLESLAIGKNRAKLRRSFKQRLDEFGPLRDTQVQRKTLAGLMARFPIATALEQRLARRERKLIKQLRRQLESLQHRRIERWLKRAENDLNQMAVSPRNLDPRVARALHRSFQSVTALQRKVDPDRLATVHRLRIGFKHHRYLCELLHGLWPPLVVLDLKAMHRFQTLMGDIQDCEVLLAGIQEAVAADWLTQPATTRLTKEVLARRARRTKRFLASMGQLWNFQPRAERKRS